MIALAIAAAMVPLATVDRAIAPDDPESGLTHIFDLEVGDCFGDPGAAATPSLARDEEVHSVEVVPCDVTHMYELIDVVVHEAPSGANFPGSDALFEYGARPCAEDFEEIVGTPFLRSELDVVVIAPLDRSWSLGNRDLECIAVRVDRQPLEQTVVGSGL